jgi:phage tail-like protein
MTALVAAVARSAQLVELAFDGGVVAVGSPAASLVPRTVPAVTCSASAFVVDGSTASIELDQEMSPGAQYELTVDGLVDGVGAPLTGAQATLTGFRPRRPAERRFDLWEMIPRWNRQRDVTGDLWRLIACYQELVDLMLAEIDRFTAIFDPERCPEPYLDHILWDRGSPFSFPMEPDEKRRLAAVLGDVYEWKGTDPGIENTIRFFIGAEAEVVPFSSEALVLGESELGVDWILGASSEFARYAFDIEVDRTLSDDERIKIRSIVRFMKPAPTHFARLIEPTPPPVFEHWELGVSLLGESSFLH